MQVQAELNGCGWSSFQPLYQGIYIFLTSRASIYFRANAIVNVLGQGYLLVQVYMQGRSSTRDQHVLQNNSTDDSHPGVHARRNGLQYDLVTRAFISLYSSHFRIVVHFWQELMELQGVRRCGLEKCRVGSRAPSGDMHVESPGSGTNTCHGCLPQATVFEFWIYIVGTGSH